MKPHAIYEGNCYACKDDAVQNFNYIGFQEGYNNKEGIHLVNCEKNYHTVNLEKVNVYTNKVRMYTEMFDSLEDKL